MPSYQCYFLRSDGGVSIEEFDPQTDAAALLRSEQLFMQSDYSTAELWCGTRRVASVTKLTPNAA
jgi:hypothetical protein